MLINEKNLYNIDNNNVNIFAIKNDVKDVINRIFLVASILYNITNCFLSELAWHASPARHSALFSLRAL